ncbi:hypothetical protein H4J57_19450 [Colwellia sp. BRX8-7]|jgi:hypothetical protein|uniref:hypothetical protein n=1 Tax=Colwellia sp. BRX8-7 TaxID=2759833 RepID=UPI0015F64F63|nr:hypothetical protein [Colwellia sp. BRX8-7]MBA6339363.1 hypothetical protein [Colwellia sp. BRX8-7]
MVSHSKFIQILAYVCAVILIPVYVFGSIALFYATYKSTLNPDILITLFIAVLAIVVSFFGYKSMYLLIRFIKTIKGSFEFDENGICLNFQSNSQKYTWDELENSKDYPSCQIFCLIDDSGNHLYSIWEYASNYSQFRKLALEKIGI